MDNGLDGLDGVPSGETRKGFFLSIVAVVAALKRGCTITWDAAAATGLETVLVAPVEGLWCTHERTCEANELNEPCPPRPAPPNNDWEVEVVGLATGEEDRDCSGDMLGMDGEDLEADGRDMHMEAYECRGRISVGLRYSKCEKDSIPGESRETFAAHSWTFDEEEEEEEGMG